MKKEKYRYRIDYTVGFVLLVVFLLLTMGCSPCERLARRCPPVQAERTVVSDTTILEVTVDHVLQTVALPPERVLVETPVADTARASTAFAEAESYVLDGRIVLGLRNRDSAEVLAARVRELERRLSTSVTDRTEVVTVYRTRTAVWVFFGIGVLTVLAAVVSVVRRVVP